MDTDKNRQKDSLLDPDSRFASFGEINPITEKIIGCAYAVANNLGCGFLEKVYENALVHELRKAGLVVGQQQQIKVMYDGVEVGIYESDITVEGLVLVEVKTVRELNEIHRAQCMNYLKATGFRVCLLINFANPKLEVKRIVLLIVICVHLCLSVVLKSSSIIRIKICCIANRQEAADAISFGASAIGLVGEMPSGPGPISDAEIYAIAQTVPPPIATFLLTSQQTSQGIIEHHHRTKTNTIQIVDELIGREYAAIRHELPHIKLVQVIHVIGEKSVDEAAELAEHVDAILLDSGNPTLAVKELGGTGRMHDWRLSRKIVETCCKPVFLAGT